MEIGLVWFVFGRGDTIAATGTYVGGHVKVSACEFVAREFEVTNTRGDGE
jgi:hypothetical protein